MSTPSLADYSHMSSNSYGDWIKEQRTLRKMTQVDLEKAADLSFGQISKYERGTLRLPGEDVRKRIHDVLGTSDDDLVEAKVLSRLRFGDSTVYVARNEDDFPRWDEDDFPWDASGVDPDDVMREIEDAAKQVVWTQPMVDSIVKQIEAYRDLQQGRFNLETLGDRKFDDMIEQREREARERESGTNS